jgi:hypothetical protein
VRRRDDAHRELRCHHCDTAVDHRDLLAVQELVAVLGGWRSWARGDNVAEAVLRRVVECLADDGGPNREMLAGLADAVEHWARGHGAHVASHHRRSPASTAGRAGIEIDL